MVKYRCVRNDTGPIGTECVKHGYRSYAMLTKFFSLLWLPSFWCWPGFDFLFWCRSRGLDPDFALSFTHVGKSEKFWLIHISASQHRFTFLVSVKIIVLRFWWWSEFADPYHRLTDPDPNPHHACAASGLALFVSDLQDANKNIFLLTQSTTLLKGTIISIFWTVMLKFSGKIFLASFTFGWRCGSGSGKKWSRSSGSGSAELA